MILDVNRVIIKKEKKQSRIHDCLVHLVDNLLYFLLNDPSPGDGADGTTPGTSMKSGPALFQGQYW